MNIWVEVVLFSRIIYNYTEEFEKRKISEWIRNCVKTNVETRSVGVFSFRIREKTGGWNSMQKHKSLFECWTDSTTFITNSSKTLSSSLFLIDRRCHARRWSHVLRWHWRWRFVVVDYLLFVKMLKHHSSYLTDFRYSRTIFGIQRETSYYQLSELNIDKMSKQTSRCSSSNLGRENRCWQRWII